MDELFANLPTYMLVGIVGIVVISQLDRRTGAALGIVFWTAVAYVGKSGYDAGHTVGLSRTLTFSEGVFLGLCGAFVALNVVLLFVAIKQRRFRPPADD